MPVTHGSSPGPGRVTVPFVMTFPTVGELAAARAPEESPLGHAVHRAAVERSTPEPSAKIVTARFDNALTDPPEFGHG